MNLDKLRDSLEPIRADLVAQREELDARIAGIDAALGVTPREAPEARIEREDAAYIRYWDTIKQHMPHGVETPPSDVRRATGIPLDCIKDALAAAQRNGEVRRIFKRWVTIRPGEGMIR